MLASCELIVSIGLTNTDARTATPTHKLFSANTAKVETRFLVTTRLHKKGFLLFFFFFSFALSPFPTIYRRIMPMYRVHKSTAGRWRIVSSQHEPLVKVKNIRRRRRATRREPKRIVRENERDRTVHRH